MSGLLWPNLCGRLRNERPREAKVGEGDDSGGGDGCQVLRGKERVSTRGGELLVFSKGGVADRFSGGNKIIKEDGGDSCLEKDESLGFFFGRL